MKRKLILILALIFFSCKYSETEIPIKPDRVPDNAFWAGGLDGGNWYSVKHIDMHGNIATISIYQENGDLLISKKFIVMCSEDNQTSISNLKNQIEAFDGNKILLKPKSNKKSCWMQ